MRDLELLAPARNMDIGIAAIDCGADAVYIAGPAFGARQAAGNSIEEIRDLCTYAHGFGARIFVAQNTIIYDDELPEAYGMMERLQEAGADAIIVQDLALTDLARKISGLPMRSSAIPLHASTQCAIRTPEKAAFMESLGFSRLILERELSLEQIRAIRDAVDCEIEFFVHGALCVCYSGQCYLSEKIAGRSANRGACIQACRSRYDLKDSKGNLLVRNKSLLSLKDFNLKDRIEDLADAGISSFKIEGRLKNISYVKNIVREYSMALDELVARRPEDFRRVSFGKVHGGFDPQPDKTFNRGYTQLFIDGKRGEWACTDAAKSMGEEIGTVSELNHGKDAIRIRASKKGLVLNNGDGFSFITRRQEVAGFRGDVCNGLSIRCKSVPELYPGATLFRNIDTGFEKEIEKSRTERLIRVKTEIRPAAISPALEIIATSEDGRTCRRILGEGAEKASNAPKMRETLFSQLSKKSGHYAFTATAEALDPESLPFLPVSAINSARREIAEEFDRQGCIARKMRNAPVPENPGHRDGCTVTYKENIANQVAEKLLRELGAESVERAYELTHTPGAELMKTKYCIKYQTGMCPKSHKPGIPGNLYLENNGKRFVLEFDCRNCEMIIKEA